MGFGFAYAVIMSIFVVGYVYGGWLASEDVISAKGVTQSLIVILLGMQSAGIAMSDLADLGN